MPPQDKHKVVTGNHKAANTEDARRAREHYEDRLEIVEARRELFFGRFGWLKGKSKDG